VTLRISYGIWLPFLRSHVVSLLSRIRQRYVDLRYGAIDPNAPIGRRGEQAAARLLRQKRLLIVAESESDRGGEIDLIAIDKRTKTVVFVEVKTLRTRRPGHPADRVDANKQARITRAALRYLKRKNLLGTACRFDVVAIWWPDEQSPPEKIEHYPHAFEATGDFQMWA
jgi:putative endonuclease